jgi:hypothetical protein
MVGIAARLDVVLATLLRGDDFAADRRERELLAHRSTHRSWGTKRESAAIAAVNGPKDLEMVRMHLRHDAKITLMMLPVVALIALLVWLFG